MFSGRAVTGSRLGFTVVELLIVIGIVLVLMGMTVPAVLAVREWGHRTSCTNNLRQIGLAFHSHHEQYGHFPSGGWSKSDPPTYPANGGAPLIGADQRAGWGFQVLPFLGEEGVWMGGTGKSQQERVLIAVSSPNPVFFCPSRRDPMVYPYCPPRPTSDPLAAAIYNLPPYNRPPIFTAQCDYLASNYNFNQTGVVRWKFPRRIIDVTDGLSSTLMVGESRMNLRTMGSLTLTDDQGYFVGWDGDTVGRTDTRPEPDFSEASVSGSFYVKPPFGSSHPGRFNAVFADGVVRSISYGIDLSVFKALGDISDGKILTDKDF